MSGAIATFNYDAWVQRYPEFNGSVSKELAELYFAEAGIYWRNDGTGPVSDEPTQLILMNMLVAHLAKLYATVNGQAPSGVPGRISNASEGSVSVGYDLGNVSQAAVWYSQTEYGLTFWQATAAYRTARYIPGPRRQFGPPLYAGGLSRRGWW